jgi:hypothetical protein
MSDKKNVKFAEEKSLNKLKRQRRTKQRKHKYEEPDTIDHEQAPQIETPKEVEESFAHYKRCCDPKDPLYQPDPLYRAPVEELRTSLRTWAPFVPLKLEHYIVPDIGHIPEDDNLDLDYDDWFD